MRRVLWRSLLALSAAGCGILSGLDQLEVVDGSVDASMDGTSSDAQAADVGDSSGDAAAPDALVGCDIEGGIVHCSCSGATCCVTSAGVSCALQLCTGVALECVFSDACKDAGEVCCLDDVQLTEACPAVIKPAPLGASATCQPTCEAGTVRLCAEVTSCPMPQQCRVAVIANTDATVGVCY